MDAEDRDFAFRQCLRILRDPDARLAVDRLAGAIHYQNTAKWHPAEWLRLQTLPRSKWDAEPDVSARAQAIGTRRERALRRGDGTCGA